MHFIPKGILLQFKDMDTRTIVLDITREIELNEKKKTNEK